MLLTSPCVRKALMNGHELLDSSSLLNKLLRPLFRKPLFYTYSCYSYSQIGWPGFLNNDANQKRSCGISREINQVNLSAYLENLIRFIRSVRWLFCSKDFRLIGLEVSVRTKFLGFWIRPCSLWRSINQEFLRIINCEIWRWKHWNRKKLNLVYYIL